MAKTKPQGYWHSLENTIAEAQKTMQELGVDTLPSADKLSQAGYSALANAINKYHGKFPKFREILGQQQLRVERCKWQDLDYTIEQARKTMQELGVDTLPSSDKLRQAGYSSLVSAITNYHGKFPKFREMLGQEQKRLENGKWPDLNYTIKQANKAMQELGVDNLPSSAKLRQAGYSSLVHAINKYHGRFPHFRALLQGQQLPSEKEKLESVLERYTQ